MRRNLALAAGVLALGAVCAVLAVRWNAEDKTYCRIRLGNMGHDIVLARSFDDVLLYRSGDINSVPEKYWLDQGCWSEGSTIPPIFAPDGTEYSITAIHHYDDHKPRPRSGFMVDIEARKNGKTLHQYCDVELAAHQPDWKLAHFDTALAIVPVRFNWKLPPGLQFEIGGEPTEIRAHVGTMDQSAGCWTVIESSDRNFPGGRVHPTVKVQFPTEDSESPVIKEYVLDRFC